MNDSNFAVTVRYLITAIISPFAAKYVTDAVDQQSLIDAVYAVAMSVAALAPMLFALARRPSPEVREAAGKVNDIINGDIKGAVVVTADGKPNITIRGG